LGKLTNSWENRRTYGKLTNILQIDELLWKKTN
jgi:hypothetical protein